MKYFRWPLLIAVVFCLTLPILTGCVSQSKYEIMQTENSNLQTEIQLVETKNEILLSEKANLTERNKDLKTRNADLDLKNKVLQKEYDSLLQEKKALQTAYDDLTATPLAALKKELDAIKKVYPPSYFNSESDLLHWVLNNDIDEEPKAISPAELYSKALRLQRDALVDGYVVSVDLDFNQETQTIFVTMVTAINGELWVWDPENDQVVQDEGLTTVEMPQ